MTEIKSSNLPRTRESASDKKGDWFWSRAFSPRSRRLACFFFEFLLALVVISRNSNGKRLKLKPTGAITEFFSFVTQFKWLSFFCSKRVFSSFFQDLAGLEAYRASLRDLNAYITQEETLVSNKLESTGRFGNPLEDYNKSKVTMDNQEKQNPAGWRLLHQYANLKWIAWSLHCWCMHTNVFFFPFAKF